MLSLLGVITYLDRTCISVTASGMMRDLNLSSVQMGVVFSAFTLAYAIFEIPSGSWGDHYGTRKVLSRIVVWWSAFTVLTGFAFNYSSLLVTRFLFGAGEAGAWPNVARTAARWFPRSSRGRAQAFFFVGCHLSGGLTPLLVTALLGWMNWQAVFWIFGSVGFVWALAWFLWFRDEPSEHRAVGQAELEFIRVGRSNAKPLPHNWATWGPLLRNRNVLFICLMYFTQAYAFNFYVTWLPTYLRQQRGFSSFTLGFLSGLPLILSVIADFSGGFTTDKLVKRMGLRAGRSLVGVASLVAAGICLIAGAHTENAVLAAVMISCAGACANFLLPAAWGTCIDIAGDNSGLVSACMNTAGQVGGFLSPLVLALMLRHFSSWTPGLYLTGVLYLLGALCWLAIDAGKPIWKEA
jgi:MFS family permease